VVASLVLGFSIILLPKTTFSLVPPAPDEVWVDDDGPDNGYDHFDTIQEGIDAVADGGTVHVAAGTYNGSVTINKNVNLLGKGNPIIKCPATPEDAYIQESSHYFEYIIGVFGGTYNTGEDKWEGAGTINVSISGFEIDGQNNGTGTPHYFVGVLWRNATGKFRNCSIHNMYGPSGDGSGEQTFGILVYGDSNVTVAENTIKDFSRGGIVANGDLGTLPDPVATIENNIIYGNGLEDATGWWAENGIQIGWGATGTVKENEVYDCMCNNPGWASSGIIVTGTGDVVVEDNDVHDNDDGITVVGYEDYKNAPCHDITIKNNQVYSNLYGIDAEANVDHVTIDGNIVHDNDYDGIDVWAYVNVWGIETSYPNNITIQNNEIYNQGSCGVYLSDVCDNISISQNDIYNNEEGIYLDNYYGTDSDAAIHYNNIHNNIYYGVWNNGSILVDAENNWWGANDGPSGVGPGSGDAVSGNVDYTPWLRKVESTTTPYGDVLLYITPGGSPAEWRVVIPSKGYDTGWMPFDRFRSSRGCMWGYYADKRYKFIFDYYSSGRYHVIFYDRRNGVSLKLAGRG